MTPGLMRAVPAIKVPGTAAANLAVLTSQLGYREGPNNDNYFGHWYGMNHAAWCAMFQSWGSRQSGCEKIIPKFAYTPSGAGWFQARGQWHSSPRVGDLGFVYGSGPRIHHVFAVLALAGDHVLTIEGNTNNTGSATGNGVYSLRRLADLGPHGGYGRPHYAVVPLPTIATGPVNLVSVIRKAKADGTYAGRVAAALKAEGLTPDIKGYATWQRRCGYAGTAADGIAGRTSLIKLGNRHGFAVTA